MSDGPIVARLLLSHCDSSSFPPPRSRFAVLALPRFRRHPRRPGTRQGRGRDGRGLRVGAQASVTSTRAHKVGSRVQWGRWGGGGDASWLGAPATSRGARGAQGVSGRVSRCAGEWGGGTATRARSDRRRRRDLLASIRQGSTTSHRFVREVHGGGSAGRRQGIWSSRVFVGGHGGHGHLIHAPPQQAGMGGLGSDQSPRHARELRQQYARTFKEGAVTDAQSQGGRQAQGRRATGGDRTRLSAEWDAKQAEGEGVPRGGDSGIRRRKKGGRGREERENEHEKRRRRGDRDEKEEGSRGGEDRERGGEGGGEGKGAGAGRGEGRERRGEEGGKEGRRRRRRGGRRMRRRRGGERNRGARGERRRGGGGGGGKKRGEGKEKGEGEGAGRGGEEGVRSEGRDIRRRLAGERGDRKEAVVPRVMIAGVFDGNLNDGGETIELRTTGDSILRLFTYDDELPWPEAPDGDGTETVTCRAVAPMSAQARQFMRVKLGLRQP